MGRLKTYLALYFQRYLPKKVNEQMTKEQMVIHSQGLVSNPMYEYTLNKLEEQALEAWKKGMTTEARELAWQQYKLLMRFDLAVRNVLRNASVDAKILEEAQSWQKSMS